MSKIGFILLTHDKPTQLRRLIDRLVMLFDEPKIVCHNDFSKLPLSTDDFPPNVRFVRPHFITSWGAFSVVLAVLTAMRNLYEQSDTTEWFVLLSGADYPIKGSAQILEELESAPYDAYLHHELIDPLALQTDWHHNCYHRYFGRNIKVPYVNRRFRFTWRSFKVMQSKIPMLNSPFFKRFHCFAGETWFTINRKCVEYILEFHAENQALARRYKGRVCVDESYIHTILGNNGRLRLLNNNKRYTDWSAKGDHPKVLTIEDMDKLQKSDAHFARKFDHTVDSMVLDRLEEIIDSTG